jgi:hypothetical protein
VFNLSLIRVGLYFILIWSLTLSCSKKEDVSLILHLIQESARLAEAHRVRALMDLTTEDFQATPGRHDRRETGKILWRVFRHYGDFKILYPEPAVDFKSDGAATATLYFVIVKEERTYPELKRLYKDPKGWLEEVGGNADLYRLTIGFVKKNPDWVVKSSLLEPFNGLGFGR